MDDNRTFAQEDIALATRNSTNGSINGHRRTAPDFPATAPTSSLERDDAPAPTIEAVAKIFADLAAPFPEHEVKTRRGPYGPVRYIDARAVRRRLDAAVGPANWEVGIEPADRWVRCTITLHLPDGRSIDRQDIGGYPANVTEEEDRVKAGASDAFKRCASMFGVGDYLRDAEPADPEPTPRTAPVTRPAVTRPAPTSNGDGMPTDGRGLYRWAKDQQCLDRVQEIAARVGFPRRCLDFSPEQVASVIQELRRDFPRN